MILEMWIDLVWQAWTPQWQLGCFVRRLWIDVMEISLLFNVRETSYILVNISQHGNPNFVR